MVGLDSAIRDLRKDQAKLCLPEPTCLNPSSPTFTEPFADFDVIKEWILEPDISDMSTEETPTRNGEESNLKEPGLAKFEVGGSKEVVTDAEQLNLVEPIFGDLEKDMEKVSLCCNREIGSNDSGVPGIEANDSCTVSRKEETDGFPENGLENAGVLINKDSVSLKPEHIDDKCADSESEESSRDDSSDTSSSSSSSSSSTDDVSSPSSSSTDDADEDDNSKRKRNEEMEEGEINDICSGDEEVNGPIRSKNELSILPHVPPVDVALEPHHRPLPVGIVLSILDAKVIVEGLEKHSPLTEGSILWITDTRSPLGFIDEIFGPVKNPYYVVRYNSPNEVPSNVCQGTPVSFVVEFASHVLNDQNLYKKGYDASGENDEEHSEEMEFSDDEKEAQYKRSHQNMKRRGETIKSNHNCHNDSNRKKNKNKEMRGQKKCQDNIKERFAKAGLPAIERGSAVPPPHVAVPMQAPFVTPPLGCITGMGGTPFQQVTVGPPYMLGPSMAGGPLPLANMVMTGVQPDHHPPHNYHQGSGSCGPSGNGVWTGGIPGQQQPQLLNGNWMVGMQLLSGSPIPGLGSLNTHGQMGFNQAHFLQAGMMGGGVHQNMGLLQQQNQQQMSMNNNEQQQFVFGQQPLAGGNTNFSPPRPDGGRRPPFRRGGGRFQGRAGGHFQGKGSSRQHNSQ
ncbi:uncharacterized protein LOC18431571 [Amborella trichopoda]|uniref:H/ACA ribonucleoprotein complex non-core subunit NAF1 n=1 Tax=Amborella trichopoda TaxID=13333 RepID=W1P756_AMBTC|nr:uncharacterized protein LOC18431571 [Amborella trichopoda]ERN03431.1 hypothetical protein AMTR_s00003p00263450 [Amborella trichopoda]|eukprot:XP_006841756.1 uncharacterized protein LOC18431571 [Amborella trichopoda]